MFFYYKKTFGQSLSSERFDGGVETSLLLKWDEEGIIVLEGEGEGEEEEEELWGGILFGTQMGTTMFLMGVGPPHVLPRNFGQG